MTEPARWRLSDGPPGAGSGPSAEPADDAEANPVQSEPIDRSERAAIADNLATVASADPEADPLAGADERGGHALGCDPEAPHA